MILVVSAIFPPEPIVSANLSFDISNALSEKEDVVVITPSPTRPYGMDFKKSKNLEEYLFKHIVLKTYTYPKSSLFGRAKESYSLGVETKKYIEKHHKKIEVIYANTWPMFAQKQLIDIANKYDIPVVLHIHDIYPESIAEKIPKIKNMINKLLKPYDKKILDGAKKIVTVSFKMKEYLAKSRNLSKNTIEVVRNWQNDSIFLEYLKNNKQVKNNKFTFMYLGNINITAGVDLLIHSFGKSSLNDCKLIIAGSGTEKEKCENISHQYQDKDIEFYEVFGDKVPELQASADVFLLPLKRGVGRTALPSKLTAYLFSAKPVIASIDLDSEASDIILDNECGFVIEPENEKQLINSMQNITQLSEDMLLKMGINSLNYAKENLSKEFNLSKIVSIIRDSKRDINA